MEHIEKIKIETPNGKEIILDAINLNTGIPDLYNQLVENKDDTRRLVYRFYKEGKYDNIKADELFRKMSPLHKTIRILVEKFSVNKNKKLKGIKAKVLKTLIKIKQAYAKRDWDKSHNKVGSLSLRYKIKKLKESDRLYEGLNVFRFNETMTVLLYKCSNNNNLFATNPAVSNIKTWTNLNTLNAITVSTTVPNDESIDVFSGKSIKLRILNFLDKMSKLFTKSDKIYIKTKE